MAHIPFYAHLLQIPTLILPGKSSVELGQALGIRSAAVAMFLPSDNSTSIDDSLKEEWKETHEDVDSFVKYVISKIPK
jgi:predicted transcriptional regulator